MFYINNNNPRGPTKSKNLISYEEGCLSLPGQFAEIERPAKCVLKYTDYNGKDKELKAEGLLATCIQHEVDHLNGILFIDRMEKEAYSEIKKDIQTLKKLTLSNKKKLNE